MKNSEREWFDEFKNFMEVEPAHVPRETSRGLFERLKGELLPSAWRVFAKLMGIHFVAGTLSLAICDQFGITPFQTGFSLAEYFMHYGHSVCMILCGTIFVGFSVVLAWILLERNEMRVVAEKSWMQVPVLAVSSILVFHLLGSNSAFIDDLFWLIGAIASGIMIAKLLPNRNLRQV